MPKTQRTRLFVAILAAVAAFGVIGPLGSRWIGPREASADASTPILVEDPDPSVFTIPPGEDPEVIADEFDIQPTLVIDGPEAFTTSIPADETSTTAVATTAATPVAVTTLASQTTIVASAPVESSTTSVATTTTSPVRLDAQSAALVTEDSGSSPGGLLIVLGALFLVTILGAAFSWRLRKASAS